MAGSENHFSSPSSTKPNAENCCCCTKMLAAGGPFCVTENKKKADVAKCPKAFGHVGLLVNKPPGKAGLLFH